MRQGIKTLCCGIEHYAYIIRIYMCCVQLLYLQHPVTQSMLYQSTEWWQFPHISLILFMHVWRSTQSRRKLDIADLSMLDLVSAGKKVLKQGFAQIIFEIILRSQIYRCPSLFPLNVKSGHVKEQKCPYLFSHLT